MKDNIVRNFCHAALMLVAGMTVVACSYAYDSGPSFDYIGSGGYYDTDLGGDKFADFDDNPFISCSDNPVSTFSVDADGASYAIMRSSIRDLERLPSPLSVRIEEFLNYFTFDYPDPTDGSEVAFNYELGSCPWNDDHLLLRLGLKGKTIPEDELPNSNYVFLIDVSGSMNSLDKINLLKSGMITLVDHLRPQDRVSIVTYSGTVELLLESTLVSQADVIKSAISSLVASGATAGGAALEMAYQEALDNYIEGGNNRLILGTDGDFNLGVTSTDALVEMVESYASQGIYLTVCGFGRGNLNDAMMQQIADRGNGNYEFIDDEGQMVKVFCNEVSRLYAVANDTKIQVTFDPAMVDSYRLIGYENRVMDESDFDNDHKDAGEIGSGQTITALYELVPAAEGYGKCADLSLRYKSSLDSASEEESYTIYYEEGFEPSANFNFAASLAAFGMVLRDSEHKGESTIQLARELGVQALGFDPGNYRSEYINLLDKAAELE